MSDQSTVKVLHAGHLKNCLALTATPTEVDNFANSFKPGGVNAGWFDVFGHYFAKDLARAFNDMRVKLGGSSNDGGAW